MEQKAIIDRDLIKEPRLWRLALRLDSRALHVMLYNVVEDNSLIYRSIPLDSAAPSMLRALEDAVYDNPALLSDFSRIDCVIETPNMLIVPTDLDTADLRYKMMAEAHPDFSGEVLSCPLQGLGMTILMGIENELLGFLRRTFNNPRIHHHLAPLCRYFHSKSRMGNTGKMYANFHDSHIDLIAFGKDSLTLANTFEYREPIDAVYYIMACRRQLALDPSSDELFLAGDSSAREAVTPTLREYLAYVMPVIFPSAMFRAGHDALRAPFDLIILPLCE